MAYRRPIWLVAGAPRVPVDAVRHLTVAATGATAVELARLLRQNSLNPALDVRCLCSQDAQPCLAAQRQQPGLFSALEIYTTYDDLTARLRTAVQAEPQAAVVMTAAVNDYEVARIETADGRVLIDRATAGSAQAKLPSGLADVRIHLKPTAKIIERIRREWAPGVYLVGFKNEPADTVVASARKLLERADCHLVVANSIGLEYNAIVRKSGAVEPYPARQTMLQALCRLMLNEDGWPQ